MKFALAAFALSLTASLASPAMATIAGDDEAPAKTQGGSVDVEMCLGGCHPNDNQTNINYSPYQVDKEWNEIMQDRAVVDPSKKDVGGKREHWDL